MKDRILKIIELAHDKLLEEVNTSKVSIITLDERYNTKDTVLIECEGFNILASISYDIITLDYDNMWQDLENNNNEVYVKEILSLEEFEKYVD